MRPWVALLIDILFVYSEKKNWRKKHPPEKHSSSSSDPNPPKLTCCGWSLKNSLSQKIILWLTFRSRFCKRHEIMLHVFDGSSTKFQRKLVDSPYCDFCKGRWRNVSAHVLGVSRSSRSLVGGTGLPTRTFWTLYKYHLLKGTDRSKHARIIRPAYGQCLRADPERIRIGSGMLIWIILGVRANLVTYRIIDLCIIIAKYRTFTSKLQGTTLLVPLLCKI